MTGQVLGLQHPPRGPERQPGNMGEGADSGARPPGFQPQLCLFLAVWLQASYLATLGLSFSIYKMGMLVTAPSRDRMYGYMECSEQRPVRLALKKHSCCDLSSSRRGQGKPVKDLKEGPTAMHQEAPGTLPSMSTVFSPSQSSYLTCHPGVQLARLRLRGSLRGVPVLQGSEPGSWGSGGLGVVERGRYHVPLLRCPGTEGQAGGWVGSRGHQSAWIPQRDAGVGFPMDPAKQASRKPGLEWCGATLVPSGELRLQCQRAAHVTLCSWLSPQPLPLPPSTPAREMRPRMLPVFFGESIEVNPEPTPEIR